MPFILRRLAFYAVAAWVALTLNFFIPRAMPGNAVQGIMAKFPDLQPSAYKALEAMLGVVAGWRHGGWVDRWLPGLMFLQAIPYFFLALVLLELLAVKGHLFPLAQ